MYHEGYDGSRIFVTYRKGVATGSELSRSDLVSMRREGMKKPGSPFQGEPGLYRVG